MSDIETRPYWEYIVDPVMRDLPLPAEPRYDRSTRLALLFLLTEDITSFPVDPYAFFRKYHIKLKKYSTIARKKNLADVAEVVRETGSKDGLTVCRNGVVSVSYNDETPYPRRILFTLLHEIGHIVLGHTFDFEQVRYNRGGSNDVDVLEKEADNFARNVVAPAFMVAEMHHLQGNAGLEMFGCTQACWDARVGLLKADLANTNPALVPLIRQKFSDFMYSMTCIRCNAGFIGHKGIKYCPICGGKRLKWKNSGILYADPYPVDDEGRATKCPNCGADVNGEDTCATCGSVVVNRCADELCAIIAAKGSARYCTKCGCQTTFMLSSYLKNWQVERSGVEPAENDTFPF